jgi:hypothetical protein
VDRNKSRSLGVNPNVTTHPANDALAPQKHSPETINKTADRHAAKNTAHLERDLVTPKRAGGMQRTAI